ncbi:MAG TPA: TRAP transporter fused permease subunit [Clostridia bacterium]|nr:TRAP transporter fused permease subunit [Clostridia bacterium]
MLKYITGTGNKRDLGPKTRLLKDLIAAGAALYLIFAVLFYPNPLLHRSIAFGLFYSVIFISYTTPGAKSIKKVPFYDWILAAASIGVSLHIALNIERLTIRMVYIDPLTFGDYLFGMLTLFLLIEGTRRVTGPWLSGIGLVALLYLFFGNIIPGKFGHLGFSMMNITESIFLSGFGVFGSTMGIATGNVMVFLMFGVVFKNTGAGDFLFDFVNKITGRTTGGVAKMAIASSALFGMVSGGALANVTTTGAMTIPAMKKSGYEGEYAACVESCSSAGGIFMPPIMGAVAFLMSEVSGIPYGELIQRAFLPAVIYFIALMFAVDFRARKMKITGVFNSTGESFIRLMARGYNFFIPLAYLITRLATGGIVAVVGLETIAVMLVLGLFGKERRVSIKMVYDSLKTSIERGVMVVSTLAACGILVGVINITGLTPKFSSYLIRMADISVPLTLVVLMVLTLFLGLAMNISSSYLIAAVLGAPVLIGLGFEPLGVHLFILYYAAMATITPPVAITSFAAASIADASPLRVGFRSMKVGMVAYVLPFVFIYNPAILLYGNIISVVLAAAAAIAGSAVLAMGLEGWFFGVRTTIFLRGLLIAAGILTVIGNLTTVLIAGALMSLVLIIYLITEFKGRQGNEYEKN